MFLQSERQPIIFLPVNLSCAYVTVTLLEAELFGTAKHTDVARPSLCVKLVHAVLKVVVHKGTERVCANTVTPHVGFANINADGTIYAVAYTHQKLPTKRRVERAGGAGERKKKKKKRTENFNLIYILIHYQRCI